VSQIIQEFEEIWRIFENNVFIEPSTSDLFNQYQDNKNEYDVPNGNIIRQENLKRYVESFKEVPKVVIIGEAPGYRGCRFSGVPFTSEKQLYSDDFIIEGERSSNLVNRTEPWSEASATIFWDKMRDFHPKFFVWNCIPFHPHKPGDFMSNRPPTDEEIKKYGKILSDILAHIKRPNTIIALGKKAQSSLGNLGFISGVEYVRHPGSGGATIFREKIDARASSWFP